ncbi:MmcQ/YjbR family DNA-binding protein [Streptomyces sp. NPDC057413]|uniref:MmcQ/YjbR family DNA-binding protein n=1 Tax=Streptomyces sp. NPDC057413 TaxID=3346124 RepID=UPI0036C47169
MHELASAMPHVTVGHGVGGNPVYQVGRKSFVFFRTPRPDAVDPVTGERYPDVIMFWVPSEADKAALVQDPGSPFFTTSHFDGHPSVLLRASRIGELTYQELRELVEDAWLSRASPRRRAAWLAATGAPPAEGSAGAPPAQGSPPAEGSPPAAGPSPAHGPPSGSR